MFHKKYKKKDLHNAFMFVFIQTYFHRNNGLGATWAPLLFNYQEISWEIKSYNLFLSGERFAHL